MSLRRAVAVVVAVALAFSAAWVLVGRGSDVAGGETDAPLVSTCVERISSSADPTVEVGEEEARDYVERTYCAPFAARGWVYADGALSIRAQEWLDAGHSCATSAAGEPARTVPCDALGPETTIDCALLHHVRRAEVRSYLAQLQAKHAVECDDGTPLAALGVPV